MVWSGKIPSVWKLKSTVERALTWGTLLGAAPLDAEYEPLIINWHVPSFECSPIHTTMRSWTSAALNLWSSLVWDKTNAFDEIENIRCLHTICDQKTLSSRLSPQASEFCRLTFDKTMLLCDKRVLIKLLGWFFFSRSFQKSRNKEVRLIGV